jgi:hypothetical protein
MASSVAPNRIRDFTSDPANNSTFGTLNIRRTFTNNTGGSVTRLRIRIIDLTTFPAPSGIADLRPRTSSGVTGVSNPCGGTVNIEGTVLEQPPSQPNGGGFNSSMSVGNVSASSLGKGKRGGIRSSLQQMSDGSFHLDAPLTNGSSINVQFLLGIQQTGNFKFFINVEALP